MPKVPIVSTVRAAFHTNAHHLGKYLIRVGEFCQLQQAKSAEKALLLGAERPEGPKHASPGRSGGGKAPQRRPGETAVTHEKALKGRNRVGPSELQAFERHVIEYGWIRLFSELHPFRAFLFICP